ncbi:hypothetical protein N2152v2_005471 [Parachlorella kessleri]
MATSFDSSRDLEVLTLNTWGLWLVSKRRQQRFQLLAQQLRKTSADVVFLQEVWVRADAQLLTEQAALGVLQHAAHFQGGAIGSGLLVLSRHPILEVGFHPYSARGDPVKVFNGDFFAGKGVGWAALATPAGVVDVFNTHLSANYQQQWQDGKEAAIKCRVPVDDYAGVRLQQMIELAAYIKGRASADAVGTIVAGDFNSAPDTLEVAVFKALLPHLRDCWAEVRPGEDGPTANAPGNSFATAGAGHKPIRIDYVWTSGQPTAAALALQETGCGFSCSDHIAVSAAVHFPQQSQQLQRTAGSSRTNAGSGRADLGRCVAEKDSLAEDERRKSSQAAAASATPAAEVHDNHEAGYDSAAVEGATGWQLRQVAGEGSQQQQQQEQRPERGRMSHEGAASKHRPLFVTTLASMLQAREKMENGRELFMLVACVLWTLGFASLAALLAYPWRVYPKAVFVVLLCIMGVAFGWAGVAFICGFVGRGVEAAALRQDATVLSRLSPLLIALLAPVLLKEPSTPGLWLALPACIAVTQALTRISVRALGSTEPAVSIIISGAVVTLCGGSLLATLLPGQLDVQPTPNAYGLLALMGCMACGLQASSTVSLKLVRVAPAAAVNYLAVVWSIVADYLVFGHSPSPSSLAGAGLISGSTLGLMLWETQTRARREGLKASGRSASGSTSIEGGVQRVGSIGGGSSRESPGAEVRSGAGNEVELERLAGVEQDPEQQRLMSDTPAAWESPGSQGKGALLPSDRGYRLA